MVLIVHGSKTSPQERGCPIRIRWNRCDPPAIRREKYGDPDQQPLLETFMGLNGQA